MISFAKKNMIFDRVKLHFQSPKVRIFCKTSFLETHSKNRKMHKLVSCRATADRKEKGRFSGVQSRSSRNLCSRRVVFSETGRGLGKTAIPPGSAIFVQLSRTAQAAGSSGAVSQRPARAARLAPNTPRPGSGWPTSSGNSLR